METRGLGIGFGMEQRAGAARNAGALGAPGGIALREREIEALAETVGIPDGAAVVRLHAAGIRAESAAALAFVPLVEMAWADGRLAESERQRVEEMAVTAGLAGAALAQLRRWLEHAPDARLFGAWELHAGAMSRDLAARDDGWLRHRLHAWAREVARSAGGRFGVNRICSRESLVLRRIERACERALGRC